MKAKFTLLMLAAALVVPAMQAQNKTRANVPATPRALKVVKAPQKADVPAGYAQVTLTAGDVWGDGTGYQMLLDADATAYGSIIPETGPLARADVSEAVYAEFEYKIPENADGALSTENVVYNNSVTILIPAGVYDYCITNPSPGDAMWIASDNPSANGLGRADNFEFVSGASYQFALSVMGSNDGVTVTIDDPNAPTVVENIGVEPAATSALVTWDDADDNVWNLRYREISSDPDAYYMAWDLNTDDQLDGWMIFDADGDGNNWGYMAYETAPDDYCFSSASYDNNSGPLTPDNWVISPEVQLCGTLSFEAWGQDPSWAAEHFAVYVCTNPDWESTDEFVQISDELVATGDRTTYEFDLSSYEGAAGVFAIRHFNITDMFRLNVDNFVINNGPAPAEWTLVEGIYETQYNIEGLTPETTYEVQVQAGRDTEAAGAPAKAPHFAEWSDSVVFTTTIPTAIADVKAQNETSNVWYNLAGMKLNGTPTEKGIYIHNGKKVVK